MTGDPFTNLDGPHERVPTLCDTDQDKKALLADAVADNAELTDTFELAVQIRANLPAGLEEDDFDGVNIEAAKEALNG